MEYALLILPGFNKAAASPKASLMHQLLTLKSLLFRDLQLETTSDMPPSSLNLGAKFFLYCIVFISEGNEDNIEGYIWM